MALTYVNPTKAKLDRLQPWQRNTDAHGYGKKIRCDYMVQINNAPRWYRVYAVCFSNVASHYVLVKGQPCYIKDYDLMQVIATHTMGKDI